MITQSTGLILVTGGTGFIGRHVVKRLLSDGHRLRILARRTSDVRPFAGRAPVEIVYGDLGDSASLRAAVLGADILINIATTMGGSREEVECATIRGSAELFALADSHTVKRIIHVSSLGVLPMGSDFRATPLPEEAVYEHEGRYITDYVRGKIAAEQSALEISRDGRISVAVLRPGIVFGPGGSWKLSRLGTAVGRRFFLLGGGRHPLPTTYVENLADAIAVAATQRPAPTGIFHILDEEPFSAYEFVAGFRQYVNPRLRPMTLPSPIARFAGKLLGVVARRLRRINPLHAGHLDGCMVPYRYEAARAKAELGWRPPVSREEALQRSFKAWQHRLQPPRRADLARLGKAALAGTPVRVALIGCGGVAGQHHEFLRGMPNVRVIACCDASGDRAEAFAATHGVARSYRDLDAMLETERPEAVHVLVPPQFAHDIVIRCLRAGCHVLVEKPMALNAAETANMQEEAKRAGRLLCVDHNHSFDAIVVEARRLIGSGAIGEVIWMDSYYGFDLRGNPGNPLLARSAADNWNYQLPGGLFQNLLPHPLSVVMEHLPEPITVQAVARAFRMIPHQATDELRVMLTTPSAGALVTVSLAASPKFQTLQVYGTHGALQLDFTYKLLRRHGHVPGIPRSLQKLGGNIAWGHRIIQRTLGMAWQHARKRWVHYDGMQRLIAEFHACVREGRETPIPSDEAMRAMQVMDETWRQIGPQGWIKRRVSSTG